MVDTVLLWGLCLVIAVTPKSFFVDRRMNWTEAQQFCRDHDTDLASVSNLEEAGRLTRPASESGPAWIGLYDDPAGWSGVMTSAPNSWRWSATGTTSPGGFQNWADGQPQYVDFRETCVYVTNSGVWHDYLCTEAVYFVCYTDSKPKTFHFYNTSLTWDKAKARCRTLHTDLAVIDTAAENTQVASFLPSTGYHTIWIGLYREAWVWSNRNTSDFRNWGGVSGSILGLHCAAEETNHQWFPQSCAQRLPFFCHEEKKKTSTVVKTTFRSAWDLTDPKNHKMILQEIEKQLEKKGLSGVKVTFKTPPKKKKSEL